MKAIIFGVNGQDGYYLHQLLQENKIETIGVSRSGKWTTGDVSDKDFVFNLVERCKPNYIFNFAANSTTRHEVLFENHQTIGTGCLNILESVKRHSPHSKVFLSGSGLQFINKGEPINEEVPFEANNAYAVERIHSVYAARYYRKLGLKVYVGYFFNHDSPQRSSRHVSKMITEAIKRIKAGGVEVIEIGDLTTKKEWGFAGDIVEAIWTLVQQDNIYEAVLGTGEAYSIEDWVKECFQQVQLPWQHYIKSKDTFKAEYDILVSDPAKIKSLGWYPKTSFSQLATMMLNH
jgi:GDPmannose 4,6-dehydratase